MESELRPTVGSQIVPPVTRALVELEELKTTTGERVAVLCERCDQLTVIRLLGMPGASPGAAAEAGRPGATMGHTERILTLAPTLVHLCTAFSAEDGTEVRPAFHCDAAHAVPGSFPWALVPMEDKLRVLSGLLRVSGFGGAAELTFLRRQRAGDGLGMAAVASGEGPGEVTASSAG